MSKQDLAVISRKVGIVFQDADEQLFMPAVLEDVMFGLLNLGWIESDARNYVRKVLHQIGIEKDPFSAAPLSPQYGREAPGRFGGSTGDEPRVTAFG